MDPLSRSLKALVADAVEAAVARAVPTPPPAERDRPGSRKEWLTNREAQDYLGLSKATLARYRADGTLPYSKPFGQHVYYRLADVEALLERNVVGHSGDGAATAPPVPS